MRDLSGGIDGGVVDGGGAAVLGLTLFSLPFSHLIMQVQQQVSDDELSVVSRYEVGRAGGEQRLHQTPPGLQRVPLGAQAATHMVTLHHLLQDGVHLLGGRTQTQRRYCDQS